MVAYFVLAGLKVVRSTGFFHNMVLLFLVLMLFEWIRIWRLQRKTPISTRSWSWTYLFNTSQWHILTHHNHICTHPQYKITPHLYFYRLMAWISGPIGTVVNGDSLLVCRLILADRDGVHVDKYSITQLVFFVLLLQRAAVEMSCILERWILKFTSWVLSLPCGIKLETF